MGRKKNKKPQSGLDDLFSDNLSIFYDDDEQEDEQTDAAAEPDAKQGSGGVTYVRLSLVEPNSSQPRKSFDLEALKGLADSIKAHGILQPLVVRPLDNGGYQIVAGERRWRAARLAELTEVPVIIKELDDLQTAQLALVENLQREDLDPLEEAEGYSSLINTYGLTQLEVATAVGKSRSAVANSLRLLTLCDDAKDKLSKGEISLGHAKILAGVEDQGLQRLAVRNIVEEGMSIRQLEAYLEKLQKQLREKSSTRADRPFKNRLHVEAELALKKSFGYPVKITSAKNGRTSVTISLKNETEFSELMKKLTDRAEQ